MFRAAETDTFGTISDGGSSLLRRIRICADAELAVLVRPLHDLIIHLVGVAILGLELAVENLIHFRRRSRHSTGKDFTSRAVNGDVLAVFEDLVANDECFGTIVDDDFGGTTDADFVHLTRDERCVRGDTATRGQDALRRNHATKVFRSRFHAAKDRTATLEGNLLSLVGCETNLAGGRTWTSWETRRQHFGFLHGGGVEDRDKE